ncbi:hypothetical protein Pcinc_043891 [Petrolisthes cinctipes]|uniref:Uncharacterized protein n=1 Tax=Petrolisthes cinctipes TaxID=88211 RepID=A0AAE1BEP7_PETCI|nr:hypothetical protein Pcinc_043891 [Petrolisthes cinctipes]
MVEVGKIEKKKLRREVDAEEEIVEVVRWMDVKFGGGCYIWEGREVDAEEEIMDGWIVSGVWRWMVWEGREEDAEKEIMDGWIVECGGGC